MCSVRPVGLLVDSSGRDGVPSLSLMVSTAERCLMCCFIYLRAQAE